MNRNFFSIKSYHINRWELCYFLFFLILFSVFWSNAITFNEKGDLVAGHANLWGDWAIHFTMGSAMAYRELIPANSPLMLDATFSYPFVTNLISAGLVRAGLPFHLAFVIPSFIFSCFLVVAIYLFFRILLKNRYLALFAAALFFFNGGVGIYYYLVDAFNAANPLAALINPAHEYTNHEPEQIKWISVLSSMVFPQRSFALGFGTCLLALSLIFHSFQLLSTKTRPPSWKLNILAASLLGILPLLHTHSFLAAFVILSFWFAADLILTTKESFKIRLRQWLIVIVVTSGIALPIIFTYFFGHVGGHFFKWFPGWYAKEFGINWFVLWFKNWTFVPFLGFAGFIMLIAQQKNKLEKWHAALVIAPGALLFLVPNLFLTQPWLWDNTKLFIWASVFLTPMAAFATCQLFKKDGLISHGLRSIGHACSHIIARRPTYTVTPLQPEPDGPAQIVELTRHISEKAKRRVSYWNKFICKTVFVFLAVFMCSSGLLDAYYTARTDLHKFTMYNKNELELAEWVKENTAPDTIWLTSTKHNHWLFNLTGRQALMTYTGWLWSHGYDYYGHERDAKIIFNTGAADLIEKYGISYVVYGEAANKDMGADKSVLDAKFEVVKQLGQYTLYRTSHKKSYKTKP